MSQITPDQIKETLLSLGYNLTDGGNCYRTSALYRQGQNPTSLIIYKDSGVWGDFGANGEKRPFEELVKLSNGGEISVIRDVSKVIVDDSDKNSTEKVYPNSMLDRLLPHWKIYTAKGIPVSVLQTLKCGLAQSGEFFQRFVFPILNQHEQIIGWTGRDATDGWKDPNSSRYGKKWIHRGKKKNWIYPLYFRDSNGDFFVQDAIRKSQEVIIVESVGDMLNLFAHGIYNVLVAFGLDISDALKTKLIELDPNQIYISFNRDDSKAFNSGLFGAVNEYLALVPYFDVSSIAIVLPPKGVNDFGDCTTAQIKEWQEKRLTFDFEAQRKYICKNVREIPKDLKNKEEFFSLPENRGKLWVSRQSFKNLKYLQCEECL